MVIELTYLIGSIIAWIVVMEMNSSQDAIWIQYVKNEKDNRLLHVYDAIGIAALGVLLAYGYEGITVESFLLGLFFFFMRAGYFSWRLNLKRGRPWNHLGEKGWDAIFNGSPTLYFIMCFIGITGCLLWLFKGYV